MRHSLTLFAALLLAPLAAAQAANEGANQIQTATAANRYVTDEGAPRYDRWVREYFDERFRLNDAAAFKKARHKFSGMVVASQLRMWQVTGEESYLKIGRENFAAMIEFATGNADILQDCFGFYPLLLAGKLLKSAGQFDPAWEQKFHSCAKFGMDNFRRHPPSSDNNQDLARLCAIACVLRLYPEDFASFRPGLDAFWTKMMHTGDLWLDSKTYTPVSVQYLGALADELGREDDLRRSAGFHQMFGNFRDVLSPNGFMPEFGHAYFETPGQADWLYVFEWAAALYNDPTFLYAAQKFFQGIARRGKPTPPNANEARMTCNYCLVGLMPADRTELHIAGGSACLCQRRHAPHPGGSRRPRCISHPAQFARSRFTDADDGFALLWRSCAVRTAAFHRLLREWSCPTLLPIRPVCPGSFSRKCPPLE